MVSSVVVLLVLGILSQFFLEYTHPVRLIALMLLFGKVSSVVMLIFMGPMVAIIYFMTLLGGMLVVFAFSIALVSFSSKDNKNKSSSWMIKESSVSSKEKGLWVNLWKGLWSASRKDSFVLLLCLLLVIKVGFFMGSFSSAEVSCWFMFKECYYYSKSFSELAVALSLVLFLCMVSAVRICRFFKGALIK